MAPINEPYQPQASGAARIGSVNFGAHKRRKTDPSRKIGTVKVIDGLQDKDAVGDVAAAFVKRLLHGRRSGKTGPTIVFPTGSTPKPMYEKLKQMHGVNWNGVNVFHLDEYVPQKDGEIQPDLTYRYEMNKNLWNASQLSRAHKFYMGDYINDPKAYERRLMNLGGPDLVILGIGPNGHLAFNEPGSEKTSHTRKVDLTPETLKANFGVETAEEAKARGLPTQAVTMGLEPILSAKKIILLANKGKEDIVRQALTGPVTPDVPASFLQLHPDVTVITDFKV